LIPLNLFMSSEYKPLSDDIAYPLASWFGKSKDEKHFSWNEEKIWPYRRGNGVGIHVKYSDFYLRKPDEPIRAYEPFKTFEPLADEYLKEMGESLESIHSESDLSLIHI